MSILFSSIFIVMSIISMSIYDCFFSSLIHLSWNPRNVEQVAYNEQVLCVQQALCLTQFSIRAIYTALYRGRNVQSADNPAFSAGYRAAKIHNQRERSHHSALIGSCIGYTGCLTINTLRSPYRDVHHIYPAGPRFAQASRRFGSVFASNSIKPRLIPNGSRA